MSSTPAPDPPSGSQSLTELLRAAQGGDVVAQDAAAAMVYRELHQLAAGYLGRERVDHTLQPTALVNEAYLRLLGQDSPWQNRSHFFAIAAQMMRRILVDHARRAAAARRDRIKTVGIEAAMALPERADTVDGAQNVIDVHDALADLERMDPRQARVVELKFFVGLSLEEIATVLDISLATVSREWTMARRWLQHRLQSS